MVTVIRPSRARCVEGPIARSCISSAYFCTAALRVRQTSITKQINAPSRSGTHPPRAIFSVLADRNPASTAANPMAIAITTGSGHFQISRIATNNSTAVASIVVDTAIPEAAARPLELPKPIARPSVTSMNPAEMTEVGIQRLRPGDTKKYAADHEQGDDAAARKKVAQAHCRIQGPQDRRMLHDPPQPEQRDCHEPDQHDRPQQ